MRKMKSSGRLTKYGILCWKINNLRQNIRDFAKFLRYDLWLNISGKRNSFEYIKQYFKVVANPLLKIAFYNGNDRAQRVKQWKREADNHLKNIRFMGYNCDEKLLHNCWYYWHIHFRNELEYKDYVYALKSCDCYLCKQHFEIMYLEKYDKLEMQNLSYKEKRKKIIVLNEMGINSFLDVWNMRGMNYINEIIFNLLKEECKEIVKSTYNGINPNNPYYLQLLRKNGDKKRKIQKIR